MTETENRGGIVCYTKKHLLPSCKDLENILIEIFLPKAKPITLDIINRTPDQSSFIDDFDIAFREFAPQDNETYFLRDFSTNLFLEGHCV